jgi:hypothetical protein
LLGRITAEIDAFAQRCLKLGTRESVRAAFVSEPGALQTLLLETAAPGESPGKAPDARRFFFDSPDLPEDGLALARLDNKLRTTWAPFVAHENGKPPPPQTGVSLRLPALDGQIAPSVSIWEEFVTSRVHTAVPRLYVLPTRGNWLDLIVGELKGNQFHNLGLNRKAAQLETEVPHELDAEALNSGRELMSLWRAGQLSPATGPRPTSK